MADFDLLSEVARRVQRMPEPAPKQCTAAVGLPGTAAEAMRCERIAEHPGITGAGPSAGARKPLTWGVLGSLDHRTN